MAPVARARRMRAAARMVFVTVDVMSTTVTETRGEVLSES
jgi:hypothetical protein